MDLRRFLSSCIEKTGLWLYFSHGHNYLDNCPAPPPALMVSSQRKLKYFYLNRIKLPYKTRDQRRWKITQIFDDSTQRMKLNLSIINRDFLRSILMMSKFEACSKNLRALNINTIYCCMRSTKLYLMSSRRCEASVSLTRLDFARALRACACGCSTFPIGFTARVPRPRRS